MSQRETIRIESASPSQTLQIGKAIGSALEPGTLLTLQGTLGAGKTNLVQAIAESLEIDRRFVVSPTFTMIQIHNGQRDSKPLKLVHIDAYRISDEDQYLELGIDEYIDSEAVVAMEWGGKFESLLPVDRIDIAIEVLGESTRGLEISWLLEADQISSVAQKVTEALDDLFAE